MNIKTEKIKRKIDVCIPTLNSAKTLDRCIKAIKSAVPYKRIIICDGYSTDSTIRIAKQHGCKIFYSKGKLGEVRNKLMSIVKTEWFAFIDSDIVVNKNWFKLLTRFIDENTGAINGFALPKGILGKARKLMLFLKLKLGFKQRGFTSNTLIRRKAVKGIKLPNIGRLEDIYLQTKLEENGWKWKFALAFCDHLKPPKQVLGEALQDLLTLSKKGFLRALIRL